MIRIYDGEKRGDECCGPFPGRRNDRWISSAGLFLKELVRNFLQLPELEILA